MIKKKMICCLSMACIFSVIAGISIFRYMGSKYVSAARNDVVVKYVDLNNDNKKEKVSFSNNNLKVDEPNGKTIFQGKVNDGDSWTDVGFVKDEKINNTKIVVANNTKDTSEMLTLKSYTYENGKVNENVLAKDVYKGRVEIKGNDIIVNSPVYSKGDSNAEPSKQKITTYKLSDNKLTAVNTEEKDYKFSPSKVGSTYYKNPSYDEIKKIIDNVANEKGIPPEVLEAIAWQESKGADYDNGGVTNWRQFKNGQPLISYDGIGIGIMQVSSYNASDTELVNRLKYDVEFNIREGAEILFNKWEGQGSIIPKVGDGSPLYREHWYYAIWAYNSFSNINNPASYPATAYQTLVIGHMNNVFHNSMIDLYQYDSSLFTKGILPTANIGEISGEHAANIVNKRSSHEYIVTTDGLTIRDNNLNRTGSYNENDVVTVSGGPRVDNGYIRYYVTGNGKSGWVLGTYLKFLGDTNFDNTVDIYDCVNISRHISGSGTQVTSDNICEIGKYDINGDGVIDSKDIDAAKGNWN